MKICVGYDNSGEILKDLEEAKACNYCTKFMGFGLHWFSGRCKESGKELSWLDYNKEANECENFECCPELIRI